MNKDSDNIGYLALGIFTYLIGLTGITEGDYILGFGIMFISIIFFFRIR